MKSLFEKESAGEILSRIGRLSPDAERQWGKMEVAQMMAHCSASLEVATAKKYPPRVFIGRLLGGLVKNRFLGDKPFPQNSPTDKSFIVSDKRDFTTEKIRLSNLIGKFSEGGEAKCTSHPHPFFGYLTPAEWSKLMYNHLDHHLRQFGQ